MTRTMSRKTKTKNTDRKTTSSQSLSIFISVLVSSAVVALVTFFYQHCTPSNTSFEIVRADKDAVYVLASNSAPRNPSRIVEARLDFGSFPLENATFEPMAGDENKVVIESGHAAVGLTPRGLGTKKNPTTSEPYNKEEILSMLKAENTQRLTQVTLWIKFKESNGVEHSLPQTMPVSFIRELINEKLTDRGI